jgi:acetylornithine deacetylase/succinyl-diaminopimelate desuccinylase-like protein
MIPFLAEVHRIRQETLADPDWNDAEFDPPDICMNLSVTDHSPALNITAPESICRVNFRPMPGQPVESLLQRFREAASRHGLQFEMGGNEPAIRTDPHSPFIRDLLRLAGKSTPLTVSYGTDGSSLTGVSRLAVIGPGSIKQAHTDDEWITLEQLSAGADLYERLIRHCCARR